MLIDILKEIQDRTLNFSYVSRGKYFIATCPFHKEGMEQHPSCIINSTDSKFDEGFFHCLSCGKSGSIATFIFKVNDNNDNIFSKSEIDNLLQGIKLNKLVNYLYSQPLNENTLSPTTTAYNIYNSLQDLQFNVLKNNRWRGINYDTLMLYKCKLKNNDNIILPVYSLNNIFIGSITAKILPINKEKKYGSNYIYSSGNWVSNALFNIQVIDKIINSNNRDNLYIVEGPRDTMNLTQLGVCSLAILGCKNFGKDLPNQLLFIKRKYNFNKIVIMMDGDTAGYEANEIIYKKMLNSNNFKNDEIAIKRLPKDIDPAMLSKL